MNSTRTQVWPSLAWQPDARHHGTVAVLTVAEGVALTFPVDDPEITAAYLNSLASAARRLADFVRQEEKK